MSQQQNNRISYASIAGRNTKKSHNLHNAETSRRQSNKRLNSTTDILENVSFCFFFVVNLADHSL